MSTLLVAAILIGIITGICLLLIRLDKNEKRKRMNQILHHINKLAAAHQLNFSSQEVLKNRVIGIDGVHRKMLVLNALDATHYDTAIIDLADVKACSVKEKYGTINSGALKARKLESYLEQVILHLELDKGKAPVEIPFYQHLEDHISEGTTLGKKARHWEAILSKLVQKQAKKVAHGSGSPVQ